MSEDNKISKPIPRYVCESRDGSLFHMHEHPRGNFVRIEHHEAEIERLRELLEKTLGRLDTLADPTKEKGHAAVTAELMLSRTRLREALRGAEEAERERR